MKHSRARALARATVSIATTIVLALGVSLVSVAAPASALSSSTTLCKGYEGCADYGMSSHGYNTANKNMYWRMYAGHNCTNYAAYMMVKAGMSNVRPWTNATGNAAGWGVGLKSKTNSTPGIGSIAWWKAGTGHVAYVEAVISPTEIIISEDSWGGDFYWRVINKSSGGWPNGFIHLKDKSKSSVPAYRAKVTSTTVWLDSTKQTPALTTLMNPGKTYWVEQTYVNTGTATWTGLELATQSPADHDSALAAGWAAANRPAVQKQAVVGTGQIATFAFPITIPKGLADGTKLVENFSPVLPGTTTRVANGDSTLSLTADSRSLFTTTPIPSIAGTAAEEAVLTAKPGSWKPAGATLSYTWKRNGVTISGATAATYALKPADVGRSITVTTTAKATKFITATRTSGATAIVKSKHPAKLGADIRLNKGDQIVSGNGRYSVEQRSSGSLVLSDRLSGKVIWLNGAKGKASYTVLTALGSLASYNTAGKLIWKSPTAKKGVVDFAVTNDGKLRLRTATGSTVWLRD